MCWFQCIGKPETLHAEWRVLIACLVQVFMGFWIKFSNKKAFRRKEGGLGFSADSNCSEINSEQDVFPAETVVKEFFCFVQKRVYFRLRNKETGKFMSADGNLDNLNLLRIQVAEDTDSDDQIWVYQDGFIKCRVRFAFNSYCSILIYFIGLLFFTYNVIFL